MPKNIEHLLLIRLSAMGDVAMVVPPLLALLDQYPNLKVSVLTKPFFKVFFEDIPRVKVVCAEIKTSHKGIQGLYKLSNQITANHIDIIADLHNVLRSKILSFFFGVKGIKTKKIDKGRKGKKALTRTHNKKFKQLKSTIERYIGVFEELGFNLDFSKTYTLPKQNLSKKLHHIYDKNKVNKCVGIAPFAAHIGKVYPEDLMLKVIRLLSQEKDLNIYLFGSPGEEEATLKKWSKSYPKVFCVAGQFDFKTELNLISHLDVMLSMDSGNGHLAAMYGVKVITIWGQTHPFAGFAPYLQTSQEQILPDRNKYPHLPTSIYGNKKIEGYEDVMITIKPELVYKIVLNTL
jgi:ADP-heptose:LPS heptosyltransferase